MGLPGNLAINGAVSPGMAALALGLATDPSFDDWRMVVVDLPSGALHEVSRSTEQVEDPVFAPDGQTVAFTRLDDTTGRSSLVVVSRDGRDERELVRDDEWLTAPMWSADGARILVSGIGVRLVDAHDGAVTVVVPSDHACTVASFQP
jgi:Tol biopolymer transport system component